MKTDEPCKLKYVDDKDNVSHIEAPITSIKTDAFGLSFYDPGLSMMRTITWDTIKSFEITGEPSKALIDKSKLHQDYYSDTRNKKRNSMNTSL